MRQSETRARQSETRARALEQHHTSSGKFLARSTCYSPPFLGFLHGKPCELFSSKHRQTSQLSQPSQEAPDGGTIVSFSPVPKCALSSIHLPIIPIPPSLLQLVPSPSLGPLDPFPSLSPHPPGASHVIVVQSFPPPPSIPCPSCGHLFNVGVV